MRDKQTIPVVSREPAQGFDFRAEVFLPVPLRLVARSASEAARFWIISPAELYRWTLSAGQTLLEQLAVAIWPGSNPPWVLVRPLNENSPPVLVWEAEAFHPSRILPQVYLPLGYELHPRSRPDALRSVLECRGETLAWISLEKPQGFQVHAVSPSAFGPLRDWVDYEIPPPRHWDTWSPSISWEFEPFDVLDAMSERVEKRKFKRPERARERPGRSDLTPKDRSADRKSSRTSSPIQPQDRERQGLDEHSARTRLAELEQRFLASDSPWNADERKQDWQEMAELHFRLHDATEGLLCLAHAVWKESDLKTDWLEAAWWQSRPSRWKDSFAPHLGKEAVASLLDLQWEKIRSLPRVTTGELSHWVLGLVWMSAASEATQLHHKLREMQEFLERFENELPARVAWLAWHVLTQLASRDVLTLARARDRFLEWLFERGLRLDRDCPRFLVCPAEAKSIASPSGRRQLADFRPLLHQWSQAQGPKSMSPNHRTLAYLDLILAFGLARQRTMALAQELLASASETLKRSKDPLHEWCLVAYRERVEQALRGENPKRPLSETLIETLEQFESRDRFKLDRLRQASRILEPEHSQDSFLKYHAGFPDQLARQLESLKTTMDPILLAEQFSRIKASHKRPENQYRILLAGLEFSPRMGTKAAESLLPEVEKLLENASVLRERLKLLEMALRVAGHFDLPDWIKRFSNGFRETWELVRHAESEAVLSLESFLRMGALSLRRYGLRGEIISLLDQLEESARLLDRARCLALLSAIAGARFGFDSASRAWPLLDEVREGLFSRKLSELKQTQVAKAYLQALGMAPAGEAWGRIWEFLNQARGIHDAFSTSSHFLLSQITIAETLVLALDGEGQPLAQSLRKRLDEEEFCLRQRIHRDVRNAMASS